MGEQPERRYRVGCRKHRRGTKRHRCAAQGVLAVTHAECEIVANAGVQLREIAERLTLPASRLFEPAQFELVKCMDAAALSISEVYGQLSALPIEVEGDAG
jgi:hypothetical protein